MRRIPVPELAERLIPFLAKNGGDASVTPQLIPLVEAPVPRSSTPVEMADRCRWPYEARDGYSAQAPPNRLKRGAERGVAAIVAAVGTLGD